MALARPAGKGRTEELTLDAAVKHILEECRMVLPGIQALFGFQLIAVFNEGFSGKLSHAEQWAHLVALILTVVSTALIMTPAALHRQAEPQEVSERFVWLASHLVLAAMFPLALAIGLDTYIVASVVAKNDAVAAAVAIGLLAVFALLWVFLPWREKRQ